MDIDIDCCPSILFADTQTLEETSNSTTTVWGMPMWACWVIIAVLLIVSALFSASENAYSSCNKYHFKSLAAKGNRTAKFITRLIDNFDSTLVSVLVGNNIVQTLMSYLSAMLFYNICQAYGLGSGVEAVLSTVVMAFLVYIVSDTVPKIISKAIPNKMAVFLCYPMLITYYILWIPCLPFKGILKLVHKLFKVNDKNILTNEDLMHSVSVAVSDETEEGEEEEKLFESDETEILDNVLSFDTIKVRDVYTPLEKVFSISADELTAPKVNEIIRSTSFSRIPVYDEEKDNIIGILVTKVYFEEFAKDVHLSIPSILEDVIYISADLPIDDAFDVLNREKVHLGVVRDKGSIIGIISMDDILEELIDDIEEEPPVQVKEESV